MGYPVLVELATRERHVLGKAPFVVGRSPAADLPVLDGQCDRRHFQVLLDQDGYRIEPLSTHPLWVDGTRISSPTRLQHGGRIRAGQLEFQFLANAEPVRLAPATRGNHTRCNPKRASQSFVPVSHDATIIDQGDETPMGHAVARAYELGGTLLVGRDMQQADIHLPHVHISRQHARIEYDGQTAVIADLNSANGTYVNGQRITTSTALRDGDRIDIGPYSLRYTGDRLIPDTRENNSQLTCHGLTRRVLDRSTGQPLTVLDNVSLVCRPAEFVCLLGPSGSGKSTLLSAMSARVPASAGHVQLNGVDVYAHFESLKQDIAVVPQKDVLHDRLTVEEALRFTARLRLPPDTSDSELDAIITHLLKVVNLVHRRATPIRYLSGGQIKRASLANEIISNPSLMFLDEVTSGLDEQTDREMMELFRELADAGKTIVCVTHSLANVARTCNLVVVLTTGGKLAFTGPPDEALKYFDIERLGDVYERLQEKSPEEWQQAFAASPLFHTYVTCRMPRGAAPEVPTTPAPRAVRLRQGWTTFRQQLAVLLHRLYLIQRTDLRSVSVMAGQSLLVALLIVMLFGDVTQPDIPVLPTATTSLGAAATASPGIPPGPSPQTLQDQQTAEYASKILFLLAVSCIWFGCNNAAKEIVKERTILGRERDVNLRFDSYLAAKLTMVGLLSCTQAMLLFLVVDIYCHLPGSTITMAAGLLATTLTGVCLGLAISAVSHSEDMAATMVPLLLIPQIILAGLIAPLDGLSLWIARLGITSYWSYGSLGSLLPEAMAQHIHLDDRSLLAGLVVLLLHAFASLVVAWGTLTIQSRRENIYASTRKQISAGSAKLAKSLRSRALPAS